MMSAINSEDFVVGGIDHAFCLAGFGFVQKIWRFVSDFGYIPALWRRAATSKAGIEDALHYLSEALGYVQSASREILTIVRSTMGQATSVCSHGYHFH